MKKTIQTNLTILLLCIGITTTSFAFAGTSQIYSPNGLPRSSKRYSTPNNFNSPQTFPARFVPRVETSRQSFTPIILKHEITTKSDGTPNEDAKKQTSIQSEGTSDSNNNGLNTLPSSSNVESLFQCALPEPGVSPESLPNQNKPLFGTLGKVMWHTLDNIGMPMFMSNDDGLDPSLRKAYLAQPQNLFNETKTEIIRQKIPQSEFEGTNVPAKNNAKLR